jgi:UDP-2,3-diacylglucosamine pyrophosphatase LpxH
MAGGRDERYRRATVSGKAKIVVSDLHIGAGHVELGNCLEDFNVDEDFAAFAAYLVRASESRDLEIELIVAGDMLEYLQVPHVSSFDPRRSYAASDYASSTEEDSIRKTRIIVAGHPVVFRALHDFMQATSPRRSITIIKGNHDVNLYWNGVKTVLRDGIGATGDLYECLRFESRRICREGIWVEHGNQYAEQVNRFDDFDDPRDPDDRDRLVMPAGSRFVYSFFNDVERERYWVDGVKPITAMIWYALVFDFAFAFRAAVALLRQLPALVLGSLPLGLEAESEDGGELADELASAVADPGIEKSVGRRYASHPYHRRRFAERLGRISEWDHPSGDSREERAGSLEAEALSRARNVQTNLWGVLERAAAERIGQAGVTVVIFGHTHDALVRSLPGGGTYVNSGTWVWVRDFSGETEDTWRDFWAEPERYMAERRLSYVWVDYDTDGIPHPELLEFEREAEEYGVGEELRSWWRRWVEWFRSLLR